jgi:hypothetical protein
VVIELLGWWRRLVAASRIDDGSGRRRRDQALPLRT